MCYPIRFLSFFEYFLFSNEDAYLKIHYDMDILPEDRSTLAKYNSDVCKWHLFVSNITEDVFHILQKLLLLIIPANWNSKSSLTNLKIPLLSHYKFQPLLLTIPWKVPFSSPFLNICSIFIKAFTFSFIWLWRCLSETWCNFEGAYH